MELLKGILGLCFLFGAFGEDSTTTDFTDETTLVTTFIISTTTGKVNDSSTTDIDTNGDIILTADPSTLEQSTATDLINEITTTTEILTETEKPITTTINPKKPEKGICSYKPCKHDGVCIEDKEDKFTFRCKCKEGFAGMHCGTWNFCAHSSNGGLCGKGVCLYSENGTSRACSCFMGMYWDEVKKDCTEPDPPCFPNPCQNGKPCKELDDEFECDCGEHFEGKTCNIRNRCGSCNDGECVQDDKAALKFCKCHPGFYWNDEKEACEKIVPPCQPNPCHNSGTCEELPTGGFNCSCANDYSGSDCKILDLCRSDQDCGNGICSLKASENTRVCRCSEGYYLDESTQACQENESPCRPNPCSNDGVCIPLNERDFNCTCSESFMGELCKKKNFCVMDGGHRYCGRAKCLNDHNLHTYYCSCPDGQYFDYADHACKVLDLCPLVECESNEECVNNNCTCKANFKWSAEKKMCEPHFCDNMPCPIPDMVCKEGTSSGDYSCYCAEGYAFDGTRCNRASCIFPKLNSCEQTCAMNNEDYTCGCYNADFELKDNRTCVYHGNETCNNKTCDGMACVWEGEEEICLCSPGYSEVNGKCVDDCTSGNLSPGFCPDGCESLKENGFRCRCEGKYALSQDGVTCTVRKMCKREEIGWSTCTWRKAKCVEDWSTPEGYRCECEIGQMPTPQGVCKDLCDVEENQKECSAMRATCDVNEYGHRVCRCPPLFQSNAQGTVCNKPAEYSYLVTLPLDLSTYRKDSSQTGRRRRSLTEESSIDYQKIKSDISASMAVLFPGFINANLLTCRPAVDYILCKSELQFQQVTEKELDRLKMTDLCFETEDSSGKACVLARSLVLNKNKIVANVRTMPGDPCEVDVKTDLCGSETNCVSSITAKSFNCSCKAGFDVRNKVYPYGDTKSIIEICKDIDECKESQACHESMDCTNTIGSYYCTCKSGYRQSVDPKENKCIEICDPSPCDHGQCAKKGDHDYECSCDAGYTGAMCNLQDAHFKRARTNTIIVGAVLGGILLLTLVLAFAFISRLRKKKHLEDPNQMLYNAAEMTERRTPVEGTINNAYQ